MIYLVYKTKEEFDKINTQLSIVSKYIYKEELSEKVTRGIHILNYEDISNEAFLRKLDNSPLSYYDPNDSEYYYKFYDLNDNEKQNDAFRDIYQIVVCLHSGNQNTKTFGIFHDVLLNEYFNEMCEIKSHDILDDITELGLLAFSKSYDYKKDNDLIYTFLYDKKLIKSIFEEIMGENTYDEYNNYCNMVYFDYILNNHNVSNYEFNKIMEGLKKYFYKKIDTLDIPVNEKNAMIIRFNHKYQDVINKQIEHQENRRNKKSGL